MKPIVLRNYDVIARVLTYDPETGDHEEMAREQLPPGTAEARGFYATAGDQTVGVYASAEGPIIFNNSQRFRMNDPSCHVDLSVNDHRNEFRLFMDGRQQFSVLYERAKYGMVDNWSATDEDVDFFTWLKSSATESRFYSYFTMS